MKDLLAQIDFGNEAGDDVDPEELSTYFVEQEMFRHHLDPKEKIQIMVAKKGVGKSALIQWTSYRISKSDPDAVIIKCRGADLVRNKFHLTSLPAKPNEWIRDWMVRLCALVNREIARRIDFAMTDDAITLVESAELDGYKSRNLVSCLVDRFQRVLDKGTPSKLHSADELELLKRIKRPRLWILIDDLDATFQKTDAESVELSTFFSACRYLTQDMRDICIRVTLRTDVWSIIRRFDESLDKMEQYVQEIGWNQTDFRRLLYLRIKTQTDLLGIKISHPAYVDEEEKEEYFIKLVFEPKMEWAQKEIHTYKVIYTLSYERPRWAIQLCKLAQASAVRRNHPNITKMHIDEVWGDYGMKRIADLVIEHKHQCMDIEKLLNAFRGCPRLMRRNELFSWINNHVSEHLEPRIEGRATRSPREIAHFLYRLGFILARSDDPLHGNDPSGRGEGASGGYEHYNFSDMPDFLTSQTNEDFSVSWEIHPCYREALDIKKVNRSHRDKFMQRRGK